MAAGLAVLVFEGALSTVPLLSHLWGSLILSVQATEGLQLASLLVVGAEAEDSRGHGEMYLSGWAPFPLGFQKTRRPQSELSYFSFMRRVRQLHLHCTEGSASTPLHLHMGSPGDFFFPALMPSN